MRAMKLRLPFLKKTTSVNVVRLHGMIGTGGRSALNDAALAPVLERAFSKGKPAWRPWTARCLQSAAQMQRQKG